MSYEGWLSLKEAAAALGQLDTVGTNGRIEFKRRYFDAYGQGFYADNDDDARDQEQKRAKALPGSADDLLDQLAAEDSAQQWTKARGVLEALDGLYSSMETPAEDTMRDKARAPQPKRRADLRQRSSTVADSWPIARTTSPPMTIEILAPFCCEGECGQFTSGRFS